MNDNSKSINENYLSKFLNMGLSYNYRKGEILFRIIYDKYFRRDLFNEINSLSVNAIKKRKEEYKNKLYSNLFWITKERLKHLNVDEDIRDSNILDTENKSIDYLKKNIIGIRTQIASITFTSFIFLCFFMFYPFKRIRNNLKVRVIFYFTLINILLYDTYLLITVTTFNSMSKKYLNEPYKKQIEKYNMILG